MNLPGNLDWKNTKQAFEINKPYDVNKVFKLSF